MKTIIQDLNKAFESRVRLGIMSALMVNDAVDFNTMKELLEATDGNLASHSRALEELNFIQAEKSFLGRKPHTLFKITPAGKAAFEKHLQALEKLLRQQNQ